MLAAVEKSTSRFHFFAMLFMHKLLLQLYIKTIVLIELKWTLSFLLNSMTFQLIMYRKIVWPNLVWLNALICWLS